MPTTGASLGGGTDRYRAPATLLGVAAAGPEEAWAVSAGGIVVPVRAGELRTWALPSGECLRALWAAGPAGILEPKKKP